MGTFFRRLGNFFTQHGGTVYTICFNAGDRLFAYPENRYSFTGKPSQWHDFIRAFLKKYRIDSIFLFGNCRLYHREAALTAAELGVEIFVFEEGYVRPHFITLEKNGVNGDSAIPDDPSFYEKMDKIQPVQGKNARNRHLEMAAQAALYSVILKIGRKSFPHYRHHRELSLLKEFGFGACGLYRKLKYKLTEKHFPALFEGKLKKSYFFVPLQTRTDFQIKEYSKYEEIEEFIDEVLLSFSRCSPPGTSLVIKHHPMERGMPTHTDFIKKKAEKYGIHGRVISAHDIHLPTCLKNARGTVTINSTVGFSSLFHETPTKALGKAVYDIEGLTCRNMSLDRFWKECRKPDRDLFLKFRNYVISTTQLNGGFYGRFPDFSG